MKPFRLLSLSVAALALTGVVSSPVLAQDWMKTLKGAVKSATEPSAAGSKGGSTLVGLSTTDIIAGLKDALRVGTQAVTKQLGAANGFNGDQTIHIPLPKELQSIQSTLRKVGLGSLADEVELKLNRGAEAAMPEAKALVIKAVNAMTLEDAKAIYDGPDNAATEYFRRVASADLTKTVGPVIEKSLQDVGAITAYDQLMGQYKSMPFVPDVKANLTGHATQLTLDGLFHYLAVEEAQIRQNPAKRTTEILAKVFGAN